jgi:hypothetical protein
MKSNLTHRPEPKALTLAMTAALTVMAQAATAQTTFITTPTGGPYVWSGLNDLSVSLTISSGITGVGAGTGGSVGTLSNSGTITGAV